MIFLKITLIKFMSRPILKTTWNAGFFSCCTNILREVTRFHHKNNILPVLDSSEQWELYKDNGIEDTRVYWFRIVQSKTEGDISNRLFSRKNDIDEFVFENFSNTIIYPKVCNDDQYNNYKEINYNYTNKIVDTYFQVSDEVKELSNKIITKYGIDVNNTIAVLYRGNDKSLETNLPSYEDMLEKILEVKNNFPDKKIFIQSDEIEFCKFIRCNISEVLIIDETKKINKSKNAVQYTLRKGERLIYAQTFLAVLLIISNCSRIILNSGNVGLWACLYRKKFDGIHQYLSRLHTNNKIWIE